jgi:hypothetical protein
VFVLGSRRYANPATYLLTSQAWVQAARSADWESVVRHVATALDALSTLEVIGVASFLTFGLSRVSDRPSS